MSGRLLVAYQHMRDLGALEQRIVNMQNRAARIAEDELDTFVLQSLRNHVAAG
jgi:hypothetical protein